MEGQFSYKTENNYIEQDEFSKLDNKLIPNETKFYINIKKMCVFEDEIHPEDKKVIEELDLKAVEEDLKSIEKTCVFETEMLLENKREKLDFDAFEKDLRSIGKTCLFVNEIPLEDKKVIEELDFNAVEEDLESVEKESCGEGNNLQNIHETFESGQDSASLIVDSQKPKEKHCCIIFYKKVMLHTGPQPGGESNDVKGDKDALGEEDKGTIPNEIAKELETMCFEGVSDQTMREILPQKKIKVKVK